MRKIRWGLIVLHSGSVSLWGFESIFVNFQTLDFGVEGPCRQTEFSCRTCGPRNSALAFCQRRFNHFLLLPHEGDIERTGPHRALRWFPLHPCLSPTHVVS